MGDQTDKQTGKKGNSGQFTGEAPGPGRTKGIPNKSTALAREAIAKLVDGNADRLQAWLDQIALDDKQGPAVAFKLLMDVMEYHIPKLARTEFSGKLDGIHTVIIRDLSGRKFIKDKESEE